jgi:hypothetical protein
MRSTSQSPAPSSAANVFIYSIARHRPFSGTSRQQDIHPEHGPRAGLGAVHRSRRGGPFSAGKISEQSKVAANFMWLDCMCLGSQLCVWVDILQIRLR